MSLRSRLLITLASLTLVIIALTGLDIYTSESGDGFLEGIVQHQVASLSRLHGVSDAYAVSIVDNAHKLRNGAVSWEAGLDNLNTATAAVETSWTSYISAIDPASSEAELAKPVVAAMQEAAPMLARYKQLVEARDDAGLVTLIHDSLYQKIDPITGAIDKLVMLQLDEVEKARVKADETRHAISSLQIGLGLLSLVALGFGAFVIVSSVAGRLIKMQTALAAVAAGELETVIPFAKSKDEIGRIAVAAEIFRGNGLKIREMSEAERASQIANAEARKAMMLDLRTAFGTVVDASVAGDFSQRVDTQFADDELNGLAQSVNKLVATVESGLAETEEVLAAIAETDLTQRMNGDYQGAFARLRDNVNTVADNLTLVVTQLRSTSSGVKSATGEILAGANDLSERTTKQAATIEETSAAMEQLSSTVTANAKNAGDASEKAVVAARAAEEGGEVMRNATTAMERISTSSAKISNIIGLIDDIAFQTNLLALNASVEAARAGEAGKGFAVVAVEVRRLAQSAANASSEVKALIQQSSDEVKSGSSLVDKAADKLTIMLGMVRDSAKSMESIAKASTEQAGAIAEINTAVRQMDEMTQHNAALVEETNAAIEQTEAQANELDRIVATFRIANAPSVASAPVPMKRPANGKVATTPKAAPKKVAAAAGRYLSNGNAAISQDWSEF